MKKSFVLLDKIISKNIAHDDVGTSTVIEEQSFAATIVRILLAYFNAAISFHYQTSA